MLIFAAILSADRTGWGASFNRWTALLRPLFAGLLRGAVLHLLRGRILSCPAARGDLRSTVLPGDAGVARLFAMVWDRVHGNRFISVGFSGAQRRASAQENSPAPRLGARDAWSPEGLGPFCWAALELATALHRLGDQLGDVEHLAPCPRRCGPSRRR